VALRPPFLVAVLATLTAWALLTVSAPVAEAKPCGASR
jgi:hypothetical protein